jgi:hypothetical protein
VAKLSRRFYRDKFMYSNPDFQTQKVGAFTQLNVSVVLLGFAGKCMADKMEFDLASSKPCCCSHWESILIHKIKNLYLNILYGDRSAQMACRFNYLAF